jgi:hypothetical protein
MRPAYIGARWMFARMIAWVFSFVHVTWQAIWGSRGNVERTVDEENGTGFSSPGCNSR